MTSPTEITVNHLSRLIGLPSAPAIVDVRIDEDYALDPRLIPGSRRHSHREASRWMDGYAGRKVIVICHRGQKLSQGVAALLRSEGIEAESLALGFEGWSGAGLPAVCPDRLPDRDHKGRTLWVTPARPKIDCIACCWLKGRRRAPRHRGRPLGPKGRRLLLRQPAEGIRPGVRSSLAHGLHRARRG